MTRLTGTLTPNQRHMLKFLGFEESATNTLRVNCNEELQTRASFWDSFQKGDLLVHMAEIPSGQHFSLKKMRDRILNPMIDVMTGNPNKFYSDYDMLTPGSGKIYRQMMGHPDRGITALAARPIHADFPVSMFANCEFGFVFDSADKKNVRRLFFGDRDCNSIYIERDSSAVPPKEDPTSDLVVKLPKHIREDIIDLQPHKKSADGEIHIEVEGSLEQDAAVGNAIKRYWLDTAHEVNPSSPLTSEVDFNTKLGGLRALLTRTNEKSHTVDELIDNDPAKYLRILYMREHLAQHHAYEIEKIYPESGVLPVFLYDSYGSKPLLEPITFSAEQVDRALEKCRTSKDYFVNQDLPFFEEAVSWMQAREAARVSNKQLA